MTTLRLAFMGTPDFAVPALQALHEAGHVIAAVYCQPARPAGRGQLIRSSPVQARAEALGLPVRSPARLRRDTAEHAAFAALDLDAAVVAAYGLLLPEQMLAAPRRGCLNIHGSLLPRWRGAAPIQAAILAGDAVSGITLMRMDAGLDTGPMLARSEVPLGPRTTAAWLHDTLARLGADMVVRELAEPSPAIPQPEQGATYAPKLTREDGRLDWRLSAAELDRRVRALNPWPGTTTLLDGQMLKVLAAEPVPHPAVSSRGIPGSILDESLLVATGEGGLRLLRVQASGRAALDAADYLRGRPVRPGTQLG